MLTAELNLM